MACLHFNLSDFNLLVFIYLFILMDSYKLTSPTPTLQETGPTVLRPIREDEAM